jgi:hypothetical protein
MTARKQAYVPIPRELLIAAKRAVYYLAEGTRLALREAPDDAARARLREYLDDLRNTHRQLVKALKDAK